MEEPPVSSVPLPEEPSSPSSPIRAATTGRFLGVRLRVAALILATQALFVWWTADSEIARSIYLISYSLMMPTVLYLLFVRLLHRWIPFTRQELLFGYIVLTATLPIIGFGGIRFLIPGMGFLRYFSETQPQWSRYLSHLTNFPVLEDPQAIAALYRGGSGIPWRAWAVPIAFWSLYLLLLAGVWLGLAAALHRIWIRQERLTFPITVLPLQITDPRDDLFRRGLFWLGFGVPALFQSLLALHEWYPSIPAYQLKAFNIRPLIFTTPPWDAIPDIHLSFYPMAVGLAYFVPSTISFSCWFFWLTAKLSYVWGASLGWGAGSAGAAARFPFKEEQAAGAWLAFGLLALWGARLQWPSLTHSIPAAERRAIVRWCWVAAGCLVAGAGLMAAVGVAPAVAAGIILVYALTVLAGARVRAEAGGQWTFASALWTPPKITNATLGTAGVADRSLVAGGHFDFIHIDIRGQSLPYLLEGLKIADTIGIPWRTVFQWVALGTVTALAMGWWASLSQFYELGAATAKSNTYVLVKAQISMREMHAMAGNRIGWDGEGVGAMLFAGGTTTLLAWLRTRLLGFPLHPVGYVLTNTFTMNAFFIPFFVAWLVKVLVQRYGGSALYRRSIPFFVGLVVGDIVIQAAWTLIGRWLDAPVYQFLS